MITCCNEYCELIDYAFGQYKCKCHVCGDTFYHQPYNGD